MGEFLNYLLLIDYLLLQPSSRALRALRQRPIRRLLQLLIMPTRWIVPLVICGTEDDLLLLRAGEDYRVRVCVNFLNLGLQGLQLLAVILDLSQWFRSLV